MELAKQVEHIEVERDQMDALLSYAREHGVSLRQAVKAAVDALSKRSDDATDQRALRQSARMAAKQRLAEHGIAAVTLTLDGEAVTDGMEYQERIRAEW